MQEYTRIGKQVSDANDMAEHRGETPDGAVAAGSAAARADWSSNSSRTLQSKEKWHAPIPHHSKGMTRVSQLAVVRNVQVLDGCDDRR
jgi:hypothetical protein